MKSIQYNSNGKINLGLFVKGKRADGYHLLETVFYPISLSDDLEITENNTDAFEMQASGIEIAGQPNENLIWKAWNLLRMNHSKIGGVKVHLLKRIPPGSGLGGGSSNAAFTLLALRDIFAPEISMHELSLLAARLGADVPFFLHNKASFAKGTGTELHPIQLVLPFEIRVVTPPFFSSTPEAYRALDIQKIDTSASLLEVLKLPVTEWKTHLRNDLEKPLFSKYPDLIKVKEKLYAEGAVYASMSGSGSAFYGLFEKG